MNALLVLVFITFTATAHAHHVNGHTAPNFEACENVQIAILNKDNRPYWSPLQSDRVASCYESLRLFSQKATPKMINTFTEEYEGQILFFDTNEAFANFIHANTDEYAPEAEVSPVSYKSQLSIISPVEPKQLFGGVFQ